MAVFTRPWHTVVSESIANYAIRDRGGNRTTCDNLGQNAKEDAVAPLGILTIPDSDT